MNLNERIAQVKGYWYSPNGWYGTDTHWAAENGTLPDWSNSILEAWKLVDEMIEAGLDFTIEHELLTENPYTKHNPLIWKCYATRWKKRGVSYGSWGNFIDAEEGTWDETDTAPIAICKTYISWKGG